MKPCSTVRDALLWVDYMARYTEGEAGLHMKGVAKVMRELRDDLARTRLRCESLAVSLERLEATTGGGDAAAK